MRIKNIFIASIASVAAMLLFAGCFKPARTGWQVDPAGSRSNVLGNDEPTAVESAMELSDRYAKLADEAVTLRQLNKSLTADNQKMKDDLASCRSQLEQTQKDLEQANNLITETRLELNNWKENVLGFREEMRDAQKAELEALVKILKMLGAEQTTSHTSPTEEQK